MIPYEELERALARWKARRASAPADAPPVAAVGGSDGTGENALPPPPESSAEIQLGDESLESVEPSE
jgi:hypothetical protein